MKKCIALLLVLVFASSASATIVGEWTFDNPANQPQNTGAAAPFGDGTVIAPSYIADGVLHQVLPGMFAVGGGNDWTKNSNPNYNVLNLMIGNFTIEFDIDIPDTLDGWIEPASKYNAATGKSDWIMEGLGTEDAMVLMWKSAYNLGVYGEYAIAPIPLDLSGGFHHILGNRIVDAGGMLTELWVDGVKVATNYQAGFTIAVNGGDIEFAGNSKYPGDSGPAIYDNFRIHDVALPEPATMALLGLGAVGLIRKKH